MNVSFSIWRQSLFATVCAIVMLPCASSAQTVSECIIQADEIARVGAATRGVLAEMRVKRAERVTTGQIMAELEASEEDNQVALAKLRV